MIDNKIKSKFLLLNPTLSIYSYKYLPSDICIKLFYVDEVNGLFTEFVFSTHINIWNSFYKDK